MVWAMEKQLERIANIDRGLFGEKKVKKALGVWWTEIGAEVKLEEIKIYRRTMKMSLQFLAL